MRRVASRRMATLERDTTKEKSPQKPLTIYPQGNLMGPSLKQLLAA